ncbi:unnamed protein product [Polarella glacialis]|uniref:PPM-type phosphatase domain-containing protein n=1 Tax=Polarella glacialis TaxID=89957 RepID=A0A813KXJ9_POLGL|nr:unnamed protein product [Polarella glacialis]
MPPFGAAGAQSPGAAMLPSPAPPQAPSRSSLALGAGRSLALGGGVAVSGSSSSRNPGSDSFREGKDQLLQNGGNHRGISKQSLVPAPGPASSHVDSLEELLGLHTNSNSAPSSGRRPSQPSPSQPAQPAQPSQALPQGAGRGQTLPPRVSVNTGAAASTLSTPTSALAPGRRVQAGGSRSGSHDPVPASGTGTLATHAVASGTSSAPGASRNPAAAAPKLVISTSPWGQRSGSQTAAFCSVAEDPNESFRPYMEDGEKVVDPLLHSKGDTEECWGMFAVFDGHGGRSEVDYCQAKLHDVILAELQQATKDVPLAMATAFKKIDGQLAMLGAWKSGCTATVAIVHRRGAGLEGQAKLYVANVGDSRAVLVRSSGEGENFNETKRVSTDHIARDAAEAKRVVDDGGMVRNGRVGGSLSVSRSLGDHNLKSIGLSCIPDVSSCNVSSGQALVIASDGLWDALQDADAGEVLQDCIGRATANGGGQQAIAEHLRLNAAKDLVERAKELGSRDNILALVVFL